MIQSHYRRTDSRVSNSTTPFLPLETVMEHKIHLKPFREVGIDIETTSLKADLGFILCIVAKVVGEDECHVWRLDEYPDRKPWDDSPLVEEFCEFLNECAKCFSWNGNRFDIKMLRTRRFLNREHGAFTSFMHCDLLPVARQRFNLRNNRLATWLETLNTEFQKTPLDPLVWQKAEHGDEESMDMVVEHCIADVRGMEAVYLALDSSGGIRSWRLESI